MNALHSVSMVLVVIGALNWGLLGITQLAKVGSGEGVDLVRWLFTDLIGVAVLTDIVYIIVGLAALVVIFSGKMMR